MTVFAPGHLSPNEAEVLYFNIFNKGSHNLPAKFLLINEGSGTVPTTIDGPNSVFKGEVLSREGEKGYTTVLCHWEIGNVTNYLGEIAKLSLDGEIENQSPHRKDLLIPVAPLPWNKLFRSCFSILMIICWAFFFVVWSFDKFAQERMPA